MDETPDVVASFEAGELLGEVYGTPATQGSVQFTVTVS